jgi:hypothetical protein
MNFMFEGNLLLGWRGSYLGVGLGALPDSVALARAEVGRLPDSGGDGVLLFALRAFHLLEGSLGAARHGSCNHGRPRQRHSRAQQAAPLG